MTYLTDENIDFIYDDIRTKGITSENLLHEMVDHICCMLEPQLSENNTFDTLYQNFINTLHQNQFSKIQFQTNLSTNLKFQNMKKSMFISGAIGTFMLISGVLFKINHWPGAGIMLVLATFIIVALFLPTFFIVGYRENEEKRNLFLTIIGYLTVSFLILGPVFKIMHWPGTDFLVFFGPLLLATLFLPFYLVSVFRKSNETRTNYLFIILLVAIGFSFMYSLSAVNMTKDRIDRYYEAYNANLDAYELFAHKSDSLYSLPDSTNSLQALGSVHTASTALAADIDKLMLSLIQSANSPEATLRNFSIKDDKKVGKKMLDETDEDKILAEKIEDFRNLALSSTEDKDERQILMSHLDFTEQMDPYEYLSFEREPLIYILFQLSYIKKNIALAELELVK